MHSTKCLQHSTADSKHEPQLCSSVPSFSLVWRCVTVASLCVYIAQHGNSEDHHLYTLNLPLKTPCTFNVFSAGFYFHRKTVLVSCRLESAMRKCWRMWRLTHPGIWRRWKPFLSSRKRRRGKGSAFWSKFSCPSTDIWTSPTTRGKQDDWVFVKRVWMEKLIPSRCYLCLDKHSSPSVCQVWRQCTVNFTRRSCPSMSRMISSGGRTITVPACPPTGQGLRWVVSQSFTQMHSRQKCPYSQKTQIKETKRNYR